MRVVTVQSISKFGVSTCVWRINLLSLSFGAVAVETTPKKDESKKNKDDLRKKDRKKKKKKREREKDEKG